MIAVDYRILRDKINYETGHLPIREQIGHPSYRKIIDLGKDVIPVILNEFDRHLQTGASEAFPGWWAFSILRELSGTDVEGGRPGVLDDRVKLWVKWGEENGYLAKDRPKHKETPPVTYKGWVVVGYRQGGEYVLCPKREPKSVFEEAKGAAAWVSKTDAARKVDDGWWKKYAWIFPTKEDAEGALNALKNGECGDLNPERTWLEEVR